MHKFEGLYAVDTAGRVWSFHRQRRLMPQPMRGRYKSVHLWKGGKRTVYDVHRLVMLTFDPDGCGQVRHLNGDRGDNRYGNLAWGTQSQNEQDKKLHGTFYACKAKLTEDEVIEVYTSTEDGRSLAVRLVVSEATISLIRSGKTWSHVTQGLARPRRRKLTHAEVRALRDLRGILSEAEAGRRFGISAAMAGLVMRRERYGSVSD